MRSTSLLALGLLALFTGVGCGSGDPGSSPPAAPSQLAVTSTTLERVVLGWSDDSSDEEGFAVERSALGGAFVEIGRVGANVSTFEDATILPDASYAYRVRSYGQGGSSQPSGEASTTTYTLAALESVLSGYLLSMRGDELAASSHSGGAAVTYTVTFLGFGFCMPDDPYAAPAPDTTPPNNVYGCGNAITATVATSEARILITFAAPELFIDLAVRSIATGNDPAYVRYTGLEVTAEASLATTRDGRRALTEPVVATGLRFASRTFHCSDATVDLLGSFLLSFVAPPVEQDVLKAAAGVVSSNLDVIPPYVP